MSSEDELHTVYLTKLKSLSRQELEDEIRDPRLLVIDRKVVSGKEFVTAYAPFGHFNPSAEIIIVGITPGRHQMGAALRAAYACLTDGGGCEEALAAARIAANFSGPIRRNLAALLDSVGIPELLQIGRSIELWEQHHVLAHYTSLLRYPVFIEGKNYSGTPFPLDVETLSHQIYRRFGTEIASMRDAVIVTLGRTVEKTIDVLVGTQIVPKENILRGLPHPSGANAGRIASFLQKMDSVSVAGAGSTREVLLAQVRRLSRRLAS